MRPLPLPHFPGPSRFTGLAVLVLLVTGGSAVAQVQWRPATAVLITYDRSATMDFASQLGVIPLAPESCEANYLGYLEGTLPLYEYARTRHVMAMEALTGSFEHYCPQLISRPAQPDGRDLDVDWPHTHPYYTRQRSDGLLDAYADSFFFGFATYDALPDPSPGQVGDFSYGPTLLSNGQVTTMPEYGVNLGLANENALLGGLISPLPATGFTSRFGSVLSFRLWNNTRVQERILGVIPGLSSPMAAALEDVQVFRHTDPGLLADPYADCRPVANLLITDGFSTWDQCLYATYPPSDLRCSEYPYDLAVMEAANLAQGENCRICSSDQTVRRVPTYVLSFATDDVQQSEAIAAAGGTCALPNETGGCIQHAFYAEDHAGMVASLGTIFNNMLGGVMSSIPPLSSTVTGSDGIGLVRFQAGAIVSTDTPYWTGTLTRELYQCQITQVGQDPELTLASTIDVADWFTPERAAQRNIYFGRPDLRSSCHPSRLSCDFFDVSCGDLLGSVPDPAQDSTLIDYGDGTGDFWSAAEVGSPEYQEVDSRSEIDALLVELREQSARNINDDPLPSPPPGVDFGILDYDGDCLIDFQSSLFYQTGMERYLNAENTLEAQGIINFVRGYTLTELATWSALPTLFDPSTVTLRDRPDTGYVGDFFHSTMAFSDRPSRSDQTTPGYLDLVRSVGDESPDPRPYTLYIGGNDGMLHAFDALTGEELWGIIPPSFLLSLRDTLLSHRVLIDGPVTVKDLRCEHTEESEVWCTLLAVSYRSGGSGVMVLDVTNPLTPRFLFELTGRHVPELGLSYPRPLLTNMFVNGNERPILILAGGEPLNGLQTWVDQTGNLGSTGSHEGQILLVMDAVTGQIYRQFDPVSHPDLFRLCGPITGSPAGWSPNRVTRVFAGTQQGCLLRFDLAATNPLQWTAEILHSTYYPGEIAFPPALASRSDGTVVAVYGQGNNEQFENVNQLSSLVSVNEMRALAAATESTLSQFTYQGADVNFELLLEPGEFLTTRPIISDGVIYFATWVPDPDDPCNFGSARVYGIDYLGDPEVVSNLTDAPYRVPIDSDRIIPRLRNPIHNPDDPSSKYWVKYIDQTVLGQYSIVFGLHIDLVPSCQTLLVNWEGMNLEVAGGAVQRQLQVDVMTVESLDSAEGGWVDTAQSSNAFSVVNIGEDLTQPSVVAVPLDWGVIMEF
ncbi:MAG: hypothetical protein JW797_15525 [Bradymonadales bacterium]|nr:hypothetical protein [Bradymonadales bacterium]